MLAKRTGKKTKWTRTIARTGPSPQSKTTGRALSPGFSVNAKPPRPHYVAAKKYFLPNIDPGPRGAGQQDTPIGVCPCLSRPHGGWSAGQTWTCPGGVRSCPIRERPTPHLRKNPQRPLRPTPGGRELRPDHPKFRCSACWTAPSSPAGMPSFGYQSSRPTIPDLV